jgi:NAD(P)H-dependent FMN reductase
MEGVPNRKTVMRYAIITGSHRKGSQSTKVAKFIEQKILAADVQNTSYFLDLAATPMPFWDEGFEASEQRWMDVWGDKSQSLASSDAIVIVTPEWGGMVTPAIHNFFLFCSRGELADKPGLAVAVSGSRGGTYPIASLRMASGKNTQLCYIPQHIIVRNVETVLNTEVNSGPADSRIRARIQYTIRVLAEYAKAFRHIRESGVIDLEAYPYGM